MRFTKVVVVLAICVLGLSVLASAAENKFGVADTQKITFSEPIRVGTTLLPTGDYRVLHQMDGSQHIMLFKQLNTKLASGSSRAMPVGATAEKGEAYGDELCTQCRQRAGSACSDFRR